LLRSAAAPIVLLRKKPGGELASNVAPGVSCLGAMLPFSPLHHLLMAELGFPVIATSVNRSNECICMEDADALEPLCDITDLFLTHDRPIARRVDDSVTRVSLGTLRVLRLARGYAQHYMEIDRDASCALAVGAQQKNACA